MKQKLQRVAHKPCLFGHSQGHTRGVYQHFTEEPLPLKPIKQQTRQAEVDVLKTLGRALTRLVRSEIEKNESCKRYKATLDADGFISLYALDFYACGADKQLYRMREASEFWIKVAQKRLEHEIQRPNQPWPWLFAGNEFTLPKFISSCRALLPQR